MKDDQTKVTTDRLSNCHNYSRPQESLNEDANLSGGARLFYIGNPTLGTINTNDGASISKAT